MCKAPTLGVQEYPYDLIQKPREKDIMLIAVRFSEANECGLSSMSSRESFTTLAGSSEDNAEQCSDPENRHWTCQASALSKVQQYVRLGWLTGQGH